ncbi:hypothetical protein DICPUDRAFT_84814 [Dictyostelium purpureum]|uniref:Calcium-dependent cell adhesion molecule 1 membrane-binding domain-containing protein n=1 Tax=Dictyostelium purpureum TaxID=5786 RepID=F1A3T9_DICPU|nr:uncharacterized protein DICPUDRAFT_84814 [Dictyostelium purpureum]EGC29141.1 hypothetical protein DICPUDRAFT_84814 [Dictyostelium purpureum]|eukprot:XP_003294333.1 hypothetical protein DICPUDRAFT_84814 [Dictyostelium purpureum]
MHSFDIDKLNTFDVRFNNKVRDKPEHEYELSIKSFISDTKIPSAMISNESYEPVKVPDLYPPDSLFVCEISVKNKGGNGTYVAYGDVHFKYNPSNKEVEFLTTPSFPKNLDIKKDIKDGLTITINYEML